jgi:hypothetical protein
MLAFLINRRNTVSVTPAIGASTVAGATRTPPIDITAGTLASGGIARSTALSQPFFIVSSLRLTAVPATSCLIAAHPPDHASSTR